jgi:hypothetical protein
MSFEEARGELHDARARMRSAFTALAAPSAGAKDVFRECTVEHYDEHLPKLRRLTGTAASVA